MKKILGWCALAALIASTFAMLGIGVSAGKPAFSKGTQDEKDLARRVSLDYLRNRAAERAIGNVDEFLVTRVDIDDLGMAHTRVSQAVQGIPVWEGEAIVHLKSDGSVSGMTDALFNGISVGTEPNFTIKEAIEMAHELYTGDAKISHRSDAQLYIYRGEERDHLVWRVETPRIDGNDNPEVPVDFIDAHTGERLWGYDNLKTGTGSSLYSGTVSITTSSVGSTFYMEDLGRKMGTFNMNSTGNESTGTGGTASRYTDTDDNWNSTIQRAGVDAHYGAAQTYDYYLNTHGRNGVNGSGGPGTYAAAANSAITLISSRVHFGTSGAYNNAFWYNNQMTYGDGNGTTFSPLTTTDICGHEMTHGVTENTANLTYSKESGALNESISDIFGAMVERYQNGGVVNANTWKIGEQAYTPNTAGDALRYMDNPALAGDPVHYSQRLYPGTCTPSSSNDYCGVHTNSSISNHAFYLLAAGGTNSVSGVTVPSIGATAAEKIFYRALVFYMTASTNFSGARTATLNAATDLYGASSSEYTGTATAWCAVGVGTCPGGGTPTPTPTATPTPSGNELLVNGGFESVLTPWVKSGTGALYTSNGSAPHGGTGYSYFGNANRKTGQTYQQVSIPSTATGTLTFWLNVTSAETTTTTQYDLLWVEVRSTGGTLLGTLATYSNLDKTSSASTYSQKSLNMAAWKGQTVRVQFRTSTDSSLVTTFRVDDASLK
ncbi:MAG: M4 family metallopeptidase [Pyrinomonadaceae bacterium]